MAKSALFLSIAAIAALGTAPALAQSYEAGAQWSGSYEEQSSQSHSYEHRAYQSRYRTGAVHRTTDAAGFLTWSGKDGQAARVDDRYGPPAPFDANEGYARVEDFHSDRAIRISDEDFAYESSAGPMFLGGGSGGGGGAGALAGASAFAGASASASASASVSVQVSGYGGGGYHGGGGHRHGHMPSGCGCKK